MSEVSKFIENQAKDLSKSLLDQAQHEVSGVTEKAFQKGLLTDKAFPEKVSEIYQRQLLKFLEELYFRVCREVEEKKGTLLGVGLGVFKDIRLEGTAFFKEIEQGLLKFNTGEHQDPKRFENLLARVKDAYETKITELEKNLEAKLTKEKAQRRQRNWKAALNFLKQFWLRALLLLAAIGLAMAIYLTGGLERRYESIAAKAEALLEAGEADEALLLYEKFLQDLSREKQEKLYANLKNKQGEIYYYLLKKRKTPGLSELAIKCFMEALSIFVVQRYPYEHAVVQKNLGLVYLYLPEIRSWGSPLTSVLIENQKVPLVQRQAILSLDDSFGLLDQDDNLKKAQEAFLEALKIFTPKEYSFEHAVIQANLGNLYYKLSFSHHRKEHLKLAAAAFEKALKFFNSRDFPINYGLIQNGLSVLYFRLSESGRDPESYERATKAMAETLSVISPESSPEVYQKVMGNLLQMRRQVAVNEIFLAPLASTGEKVGKLKEANEKYETEMQQLALEASPKEGAGKKKNVISELDWDVLELPKLEV